MLFRSGKKEGIKQGIEQGIEQGSKQSKIKTAKKMLLDNESIKTIMKYTELSKKEIEALKE